MLDRLQERRTPFIKKYEVDIFVISGEHASKLLGRQAACEMGTIAGLEEVDEELFGEIGLF